MSRQSHSHSRNPRSHSKIQKDPGLDPDIVILTGNDQDSNEQHDYPAPVAKFAKLRYGENLELLFNINCQIQYLMEYFREKCKKYIISPENIDIADTDAIIKNIREKSVQSRSASDILAAREIYILIDIKSTELKTYNIVTPLLTNSDILTTSFLAKLCPKPPKNYKSTLSNSMQNNPKLNNPRVSIAGPPVQLNSINKSGSMPQVNESVSKANKEKFFLRRQTIAN